MKLLPLFLDLMKNKKVIGFGLMIAACQGIIFSFASEGSFYLIKMLELPPIIYGFSFIAISAGAVLGGFLSRKLNDQMDSLLIINKGLFVIISSILVHVIFAILYYYVFQIPSDAMIIITLLSRVGIGFGISMVIANSLARALEDYKLFIGTASSLFGFFYAFLVSIFNFGMGLLHNGTLMIMPLYFLCLAVFMTLVKKFLIDKNSHLG